MEELFREVLRGIESQPARFVAEVVQSALLLALIAWAGWKPARRRLGERRERIAAALAAADEDARETTRLKEELRAIAARAGEEPAALLQAASERASAERGAAAERIEAEARARVAAAHRQVEEDRERAGREASARLVRLTTDAARRYVEDVLDETERRALTRKAVLATLDELLPETSGDSPGVTGDGRR
jgi:F0F1-type ATP synthase membrane subunit b/b'